LQESQAGTILSPVTFVLIMWALKVGALLQFDTEHSVDQDVLEPFNQCCFQVPQLQLLSLVPTLFFQLLAVTVIFFVF
jgi:hypothetical protein